jgi:hypothetical protein
MMNTRTDKAALALILALAATRLLAPWPNFNPVLAAALLGGAVYSSRKLTLAIPLAAMVLGDAALALVFGMDYAVHSTQWAVYGCVAAIALFGRLFSLSRPVALVAGAGTAAGVFFFLVTNAAAWYGSAVYPQDLSGLMMSYAAGLAFARDYGLGIPSEILSTWVALAVSVAILRTVPRAAVPTAERMS